MGINGHNFHMHDPPHRRPLAKTHRETIDAELDTTAAGRPESSEAPTAAYYLYLTREEGFCNWTAERGEGTEKLLIRPDRHLLDL